MYDDVFTISCMLIDYFETESQTNTRKTTVDLMNPPGIHVWCLVPKSSTRPPGPRNNPLEKISGAWCLVLFKISEQDF